MENPFVHETSEKHHIQTSKHRDHLKLIEKSVHRAQQKSIHLTVQKQKTWSACEATIEMDKISLFQEWIAQTL